MLEAACSPDISFYPIPQGIVRRKGYYRFNLGSRRPRAKLWFLCFEPRLLRCRPWNAWRKTF